AQAPSRSMASSDVGAAASSGGFSSPGTLAFASGLSSRPLSARWVAGRVPLGSSGFGRLTSGPGGEESESPSFLASGGATSAALLASVLSACALLPWASGGRCSFIGGGVERLPRARRKRQPQLNGAGAEPPSRSDDSGPGRRWSDSVGGFPLVGQLRDLWRRRLRVSALLAALLAGLWLLQGLQGWQGLQDFNQGLPWYKRLSSSTAVESWLFGTHQAAVGRSGQRIQVTMSALQQNFGMDCAAVAQHGQLYRLLTACFLHNGVFHILFNLGYLYTLAPLEAGSQGPFLTTFLLSGIAGNLAFMHFGGVANSAHLGGLGAGICVALVSARRSGYRGALLPWPVLVAALGASPPGRLFVRSLWGALALGV
ncbi:unnamed protein product, partial [Polarella glacialis]